MKEREHTKRKTILTVYPEVVALSLSVKVVSEVVVGRWTLDEKERRGWRGYIIASATGCVRTESCLSGMGWISRYY